MKHIIFLQKSWNIVMVVAVGFTLLIAGFVVPPGFSTDLIESTIDYNLFSRFITCIALFMFLIPAIGYNKRRYSKIWFGASVLLLILSFALFFGYYRAINSKTIKYANKRFVIGNNYLPKIKLQIIQLTQNNYGELNPETVVNFASGNIAEIWPQQERQMNSIVIIIMFLSTIITFTLTAVSSIQAVYCISKT